MINWLLTRTQERVLPKTPTCKSYRGTCQVSFTATGLHQEPNTGLQELGGGSQPQLPSALGVRVELRPPFGCTSAQQFRLRHIPLDCRGGSELVPASQLPATEKLGEPQRRRTPGPGKAGSSARGWYVPGGGAAGLGVEGVRKDRRDLDSWGRLSQRKCDVAIRTDASEMTDVEAVVSNFASSARAGRRNAIPDIQGSAGTGGTSELPIQLQALAIKEDVKKKNEETTQDQLEKPPNEGK